MLSRLSAISWTTGLVAGVLTCFGLRFHDLWRSESGLIGWFGPIVIGLAALAFGYLITGWISGLFFARVGRGGWNLRFSNEDYQREFDLINQLSSR